MTLRVVRQPPGGSALVRDYLSGNPEAARFYSGSPHSFASYQTKLREVELRFDRAARERVARVLSPTSPTASARLGRFVEEGGFVVTTGQQTGLFTGPAYTLYKAITAAKLARDLEDALGKTALPVYWCASEDHDWAEVNHTYLFGYDRTVHRVSLPPLGSPSIPMSRMPLGGEVDSALALLRQVLGGQGVGYHYLDRVEAAYGPHATVGGAFHALLAQLLAPFNFCMVDAADPTLKQASLPILLVEAETSARHERVLDERTADLVAAGYHAQVTLMPGATNLFWSGFGPRERLDRRGEGFVTHLTGRRLSLGELLARAATEPSSLSPNVLLRPVVETAVLPTLAYVGGPGEIAYFAQLAPLFGAHGFSPPVVVPRDSALLLPDWAEESLGRLDLQPSDFSRTPDQLASTVARRGLPAGVEEALAQLRNHMAERFAALADAGVEIDPTLRAAVHAERDRTLHRAAILERRMVAGVKRHDALTMRRISQLSALIRPAGFPQDRALNLLSFLVPEGPQLLDLISAEFVSPLSASETATGSGPDR